MAGASESAPDSRLDFLGSFVQKTLKLKPEKWGRLLATEEYKAVVLDFLDKPDTVVLIILQVHMCHGYERCFFVIQTES